MDEAFCYLGCDDEAGIVLTCHNFLKFLFFWGSCLLLSCLLFVVYSVLFSMGVCYIKNVK